MHLHLLFSTSLSQQINSSLLDCIWIISYESFLHCSPFADEDNEMDMMERMDTTDMTEKTLLMETRIYEAGDVTVCNKVDENIQYGMPVTKAEAVK